MKGFPLFLLCLASSSAVPFLRSQGGSDVAARQLLGSPVVPSSHVDAEWSSGMEGDVHKPLMPLAWTDYLGILLASAALVIAAAGGIGGGGILVPLYTMVLGFAPKLSIPLSNATILGGAVSSIFLNSSRRHPTADRPLVDWDIILMMEPLTIAGALVGSYINRLLPGWLLSILLVILLVLTARRTLTKGIAMFQFETKVALALASATAAAKTDPATAGAGGSANDGCDGSPWRVTGADKDRHTTAGSCAADGGGGGGHSINGPETYAPAIVTSGTKGIPVAGGAGGGGGAPSEVESGLALLMPRLDTGTSPALSALSPHGGSFFGSRRSSSRLSEGGDRRGGGSRAGSNSTGGANDAANGNGTPRTAKASPQDDPDDNASASGGEGGRGAGNSGDGSGGRSGGGGASGNCGGSGSGSVSETDSFGDGWVGDMDGGGVGNGGEEDVDGEGALDEQSVRGMLRQSLSMAFDEAYAVSQEDVIESLQQSLSPLSGAQQRSFAAAWNAGGAGFGNSIGSGNAGGTGTRTGGDFGARHSRHLSWSGELRSGRDAYLGGSPVAPLLFSSGERWLAERKHLPAAAITASAAGPSPWWRGVTGAASGAGAADERLQLVDRDSRSFSGANGAGFGRYGSAGAWRPAPQTPTPSRSSSIKAAAAAGLGLTPPRSVGRKQVPPTAVSSVASVPAAVSSTSIVSVGGAGGDGRIGGGGGGVGAVADGNTAAEKEMMAAELQQLLEKERGVALWKVAAISGIFTVEVVMTVFKEGLGGMPPVVKCGTWGYWLATAAMLAFVGAASLAARAYLIRQHALKVRVGYAFTEGDVRWDQRSTTLYPPLCFLAGLFAGLFGIGGGIVKGPIMLEMGVKPQVAAATASTMIFFTSMAATFGFLVAGAVQRDYATLLFVAGLVANTAGAAGTQWLVHRHGRHSVIVLSIGAVVLISAALMSYESLRDVATGAAWREPIEGICSD